MAPFVQVIWPTTGIEFGTAVTTDSTYALGPTNLNIPSDMNGKLCVVFFRASRNPVYLETPAGWDVLMPSVTNAPMGVLYRVCDGTEGSTISIGHYSDGTLLTNTQSAFVSTAYAITGVATSETDFIEAEFALSDNPPSLTPSWGSAANKWIAMYSSRYNDWTSDAPPTNYSALFTNISANTVSIDYTGITAADRVLTATSEDPGVFTITAGTNPLTTERVMTLALRPA